MIKKGDFVRILSRPKRVGNLGWVMRIKNELYCIKLIIVDRSSGDLSSSKDWYTEDEIKKIKNVEFNL